MATTVLEPLMAEMVDEGPVTTLQEIAETIEYDALREARTKMIQPERATGLSDLLQRSEFVNLFKFSMAGSVAGQIAAYDSQVQAVYYFDPYLNPDAETETYMFPDPTVNLLIQVAAKSAALQSFIDALDQALAAQMRQLPSPIFSSLTTILNGIVITETDVAEKRGYATLLSSFYLRPRRLL